MTKKSPKILASVEKAPTTTSLPKRIFLVERMNCFVGCTQRCVPQWGTVDTEPKDPSAENQEQSKILS